MKAGTKEYYKNYYQNKDKEVSESQKQYWREKALQHNKERRHFVKEYKSKCSCKKCGDARPYVLDFHHIDPSTKLFDLGDTSKKGIKKLQEEIDKCVVLCKNCHSEFHYLEKEQNISITDYLN
jgi:Zn finger protein HypA/HybF involved in hydrogenase expression